MTDPVIFHPSTQDLTVELSAFWTREALIPGQALGGPCVEDDPMVHVDIILWKAAAEYMGDGDLFPPAGAKIQVKRRKVRGA